MSFFGIRGLAACSKSPSSAFPPNLRSLRPPLAPSSNYTKRRLFSSNVVLRNTSSQAAPVKQSLGRITPKRIAVRLPPGSGNGEGASGIPKATVWGPILFCVLVGGGGLTAAAVYTNLETGHFMMQLSKPTFGLGRAPNEQEVMRAKFMAAYQETGRKLQSIRNSLANSFVPPAISQHILRLYTLYQEWNFNTPPGQLIPQKIVGCMGVIFVGWQITRLRPFMRRWFLHHPVVFGGTAARLRQNITLFTSTISHQSLPHFLFNSIAFTSFGAASYAFISSPPPGETPMIASTRTPAFLAFLLCAGLFASLSSHLYTNLVKLPRLVKSLTNPARLSSAQALAAHEAIAPGLGASGAIYAAVTLTACAFPETSIALIFLPWFSFPVGLGVAGMVTFDLIGLIRGWKMFDHVAHLGGAFFGVVWYQYGRQIWVKLRQTVAGTYPTS